MKIFGIVMRQRQIRADKKVVATTEEKKRNQTTIEPFFFDSLLFIPWLNI
jgi:hypothetical protein